MPAAPHAVPRPAVALLASLAALLSVLAAGCASRPPEPAEPPLRPASVAVPEAQRQLRVQYASDDVKVGYVAEVAPDRGVVAVTDLDTTGLQAGDAFLIFSQTQQPVAYAVAFSVTPNAVFADYKPDFVTGGRAPRVGDLAGFNLAPRR